MYDFIRRLDEALEMNSRRMVEAARKFRQAKIITETRAPQQGAFWFVPDSDGNWDVYAFFESNYSNTDHSVVWDRYLSKYIFGKPSRDIRNAYAGLPRGRVVILKSGPVIYHGNDLPSSDAIKKVANEFNLPRNKYKAIFEEHEQMIREHHAIIKRAFNFKYNLKAPEDIDFGDYEDYEDYDEAI